LVGKKHFNFFYFSENWSKTKNLFFTFKKSTFKKSGAKHYPLLKKVMRSEKQNKKEILVKMRFELQPGFIFILFFTSIVTF
jgi:hypothetical protein